MTARSWYALAMLAPLALAAAVLLPKTLDRAELFGQAMVEAVEPGATVYCAGWIVENPDQAGQLDRCIADQNDLALKAARMLAGLERKSPRIARIVENECRLPGDVRFREGGFGWRIDCYRHVAGLHGATWPK